MFTNRDQKDKVKGDIEGDRKAQDLSLAEAIGIARPGRAKNGRDQRSARCDGTGQRIRVLDMDNHKSNRKQGH